MNNFFNRLDIRAIPLDLQLLHPLYRRCRPRILIVTDGNLSYRQNQGFGLWRFIHAITHHAGVTNKPILTLAHRGAHTATVTVETDTYTVKTGYNFATANPSVNRTNYDQIWLFGFSTNGGINDSEVEAITDFMNAGGGVFATGDHGALGNALCGRLPRIRHMREWTDIPMGLEGDAEVAVNRIDTVVDPGANNRYEFSDQSDDIPQRIYPNYTVTNGAAGWEARIHSLLRMPGEPTVRLQASGNTNFTNDIDVHPDHPHESVCYNVHDNSTLTGNYTEANYNFEEFQPAVVDSSRRIKANIIAYGVSGGRAINTSIGNKPPVTPQMFGVVSVYNGRAAQRYSGQSQRPGRIVCNSTWHHFVNINLDGIGTSRNGLGSWSGGSPNSGDFTPSADLEKIYVHFRNMVNWLQPSNKIWCRLWWLAATARFHPQLVEELVEVPKFKTWRDFVAIGGEFSNVLAQEIGDGAAQELVYDLLLSEESTEQFADLFNDEKSISASVDSKEFVYGIMGKLISRMAYLLDYEDAKGMEEVFKTGIEKHVDQLREDVKEALVMGVRENESRARATQQVIKRMTELVG
ncbi:MAG: hypothetical protein ACRBHB_25845 [Arenicella sp.]